MNEFDKPIMRLDDLYIMTAHIYGDKNSVRSKEATFAHFVEVCGALTVFDRKKKREKIEFVDALCKALGWYFPLMAKMRIRSVERLVFRKFPGVCPYCRQVPHQEEICKQVRGTENTVNHADVKEHFNKSWENRPQGLNEWQKMFGRIYPRNVNDSGRSSLGILEEIGELSEAIRVFDNHPHYFIGESADIFSYIMGIANEYAIREAQEDREFSFEREYLMRYPGLCTQCGSKICSCPAIPLATVGRMAKEINITTEENLFIDDLNSFERAGSEAAQSALESMGGFAGLVDKLPFDRGDTNHGLVQICMKIAAAFEASSPDIASKLRGEAIRLGDLMKEAGTPRENLDIADLISKLRTLWKELDEKHRTEIKDSGGLTSDIGEIFDSVRVLFVSCNPNTPERPLKLHVEQRAVKESLKLGPHGNKISISDLHAATPDDFRRELLHNEYDVIHFSGHADENALIFETLDNRPIEVSIDAVKNMISQYKSIKCVVLNACESAKKITHSISNITIGMDETIPDDAAIAFSRGFYDALAAGKDFQRAFKEGVTAVEIAGHGGDYIKMITAA